MCFTLAAHAEQTGVPRIVVNVLINGLRSDYLQTYAPRFGERGFKRLEREAMIFTQVEYPYGKPDKASAAACFATGASPMDNGIVSETWLDRKLFRPIFCVEGSSYDGLHTTEKVSPEKLLVSTMGDELKVATEGTCLVYGVAPDREMSTLMAGHAGDGAFWINDDTGHWCSTSYYGEYPDWAETYDRNNGLERRISKLAWEPMHVDAVTGEGKENKPFSHTFTGERRYKEYKASGLVSEETVAFAVHLMESTQMGMDAATDMLSVGLYAGSFDHRSEQQFADEVEDTYVRLDKSISTLIDAVERKVGQGRALFVVTSTGVTETETEQDLARYRIPTGTFNITRASLLLNMYLVAVYGQGQWVEAVMGDEIFLSRSLMERHTVNVTEMLQRSCDFLMQLSGVKDVTPMRHPILGDLKIKAAPGWVILNEETGKQIVSRESYVGFPLYFLGGGVSRQKVDTPVTIDRVAPTVSRAIHIRAPNGCGKAPLF